MTQRFSKERNLKQGGDAFMKENKWVSFEQLKAVVSIKDILDHYGLTSGLKQKGNELIGLCPFHEETKASFRANLQKNVFHCFGCKAKGNILGFVALKEGVDIREAALMVQDWFGIQPQMPSKGPVKVPETIPGSKEPNEAKTEANQKVVNVPLTFTFKKLNPEHQYLKDRGLKPETVQYFGLGFCSHGLMKNRIVIPIHNEKGELVAYAGRWPGNPPQGEPKYKLPKGFHKSLVVFNLHRVREIAKGKELILVEGFFDCFKIWQAGFKNVVALMGSALSKEQERLILGALGPQSKIILMFDGDEAGKKCTEDVFSRLSNKCKVRVTRIEHGKQPEDLAKQALEKMLSPQELKSIDIVKIRMIKSRSIPYGKTYLKYSSEVASLVRRLLGNIDREVFGVINLSTANTINSIQFVSLGTLNASLVSPREAFKSAILSNSAFIIAFHNHPSGKVDYSQDDLKITKQLVEAGKILDIKVLDHVIVGEDEHFSFLNNGLL